MNKNLLLELMRRWDSKRHMFVLPCGDIGLTLKDVVLTFGLRVVGVPVVLDDDEPFLDLESWFGAFMWKRSVAVASVENRLDSLGDICNEDFVRTFLLYTFGTFLFPNADGKIDTRYLSLLQNVDRISSYAWGQAILLHLVKWLDKRKETDAVYVGGCLLFLQIWSFEHINIARPASLDVCTAFPRVCQWDKTKSSNRQQLVSKFKDLQYHEVIWELQPTSLELEVEVVKELLEAQCMEKEISEVGTSSVNFTDFSDIKLEARRQFRNQEVIQLETESETSLTSDGQSKREVNLDCPDVIHCCSTPHIFSKLQSQKQPNQVALHEDSSTAIDDDDVRTREQILEEQNMHLKEELLLLKLEIEFLKSSRSELEENNAKLMSENDDLRRKNQFLSLSSYDFVGRMEKILLDDITNNEVSQTTQESGAETANTSVSQIESTAPR